MVCKAQTVLLLCCWTTSVSRKLSRLHNNKFFSFPHAIYKCLRPPRSSSERRHLPVKCAVRGLRWPAVICGVPVQKTTVTHQSQHLWLMKRRDVKANSWCHALRLFRSSNGQRRPPLTSCGQFLELTNDVFPGYMTTSYRASNCLFLHFSDSNGINSVYSPEIEFSFLTWRIKWHFI